MKKLGVVAFAVVLGACSKQAPKPMDPNQDPAARAVVEQVEEFRDQMCACQDAACVAQVTDAREAWLTAPHPGVTLSEDQQRARDTANAAFDDCAAKVGAPGDAEAAPAIAELGALRDEMCACRDKACADRVTQQFMAAGEKYKDTKASDAQLQQATAIAEAYAKCMMNAIGATP